MVDKLKIGMIGLGRISSLHLPAYKPENGLDAELVAICDSNKKRIKEVSQEYTVEKTFTDYEDLLKDPEIDAVEILTPHHLHLPMVLKAAEAKKHISLQKVPAMTLSDMDQMIAATKKTDVKFRVFENSRFYPPYQKAMDLINQGVIGKTIRVDYQMWSGLDTLSQWEVPLKSWAWRISEKGNYKSPTLFDDGYHKHSVISQFLNQPIKSVIVWQGEKRIKGTIKWDLPSSMIYICKNKANFATWNTSLHDFIPMHSKYYGCDEYVSIFGEKGAIYIPGCTGSWFKDCGDHAPGQAGIHWQDEKGHRHKDIEVDTDWLASFTNCSREFINAIHEDRQPEVNPQEARYILQIGLAAIRSARSNFREIKLKDIKDKP